MKITSFKTLLLLAFVLSACGGGNPDPTPPELSCESVVSADIKVSGCSSTGGCWATMVCNRAPLATDYMGPAVKCSAIVDTERTDDYFCRW